MMPPPPCATGAFDIMQHLIECTEGVRVRHTEHLTGSISQEAVPATVEVHQVLPPVRPRRQYRVQIRVDEHRPCALRDASQSIGEIRESPREHSCDPPIGKKRGDEQDISSIVSESAYDVL